MVVLDSFLTPFLAFSASAIREPFSFRLSRDDGAWSKCSTAHCKNMFHTSLVAPVLKFSRHLAEPPKMPCRTLSSSMGWASQTSRLLEGIGVCSIACLLGWATRVGEGASNYFGQVSDGEENGD